MQSPGVSNTRCWHFTDIKHEQSWASFMSYNVSYLFHIMPWINVFNDAWFLEILLPSSPNYVIPWSIIPIKQFCSPHDKPTTMLCWTNKRRYFYAIYFAFSFSILIFSSFFAIFSTFVNSSYKMGERYLRRSCNVRGNHSNVSLLFSFWNIRITS